MIDPKNTVVLSMDFQNDIVGGMVPADAGLLEREVDALVDLLADAALRSGQRHDETDFDRVTRRSRGLRAGIRRRDARARSACSRAAPNSSRNTRRKS